MKVLITGAPGFIATHVLRRFAAAGAEVHALVRPPAHRLKVPGVNVIPARLDRMSSMALMKQIPEVDVVCHLAADTAMNASVEEMEVNIEGTRNLLAHLGEGLRGKRFLFASSIAAVDRKRFPTAPLTTEDPPAPRSPYALSKLACEELLAAEAKARGFDLAMLRLGTIYGPGQKAGGVVTLAEAAKNGGAPARLPWPGKISFCYVEDVAEVFFRLADRPEPLSGTWFVSEDRGHTMAEAAEMLRKIHGADWKPLPVPASLFKGLNRILWTPGIRERNPWALRAALADTILCDSTPIADLLGIEWTPLEEGLRRTFG